MKAFALAWLSFLAPVSVRADGMMFGSRGPTDVVYEEAQSAWVSWKDGRETLTLAVDPGGDAPRLAWLVPLPVPASQAELSLAEGAPSWGGREVRADARQALAPGLLFVFFLLFLLVGAGMGEAAVVIGIIALLSAIAIPKFGGGGGRVDVSVRESGRVELAGVASELVEAGSLESFKVFLSSKSLVLPAAADAAVAEHLKAGHAFIVSWADRPDPAKSLSLRAEFPAPRPWYPVRLTSAYGAVRTPIDLRVEGWLTPEGLPDSAKFGYYAGEEEPRETTRVVFQGYADELASDWTFSPRARAADLMLASWVARHGSESTVLIVLAAALVSGVGVWFALWGAANPGRALLFGASGLLPVLGPTIALRVLRSSIDEVPPIPLPEGMSEGEARLLKRSGLGFFAAQALSFALAVRFDEGPVFILVYLCGAAGTTLLLRAKGHPWAHAAAVGIFTCLFIVLGPLVCAFPEDPRDIAAAEAKRRAAGVRQANYWRRLLRRPEVPEPAVDAAPVTPAETRWKRAALVSGLLSLALAEAATFGLAGLWPLERSTTVISSRGGLVQKSLEGATRGNIGALRSAVAVYRGDHGDRAPATLAELTEGGKYISVIPKAKLADHPDSAAVKLGTRPDDAGGWLYDPASQEAEGLKVNCTHRNLKGRRWDDE